jgi:hypothetical protein
MRPALPLFLTIATLVAVASPVRADEHWIDAAPTTATVKSAWREGSVATGTEDGKSFVRIKTDGLGHPTFATLAPITPTVDAKQRFVKVMLRVHDFDELAGIEIRIGSGDMQKDWYAYTVPLYADRDYNLLQDGAWTAVTMSLGKNNATGAPKRGAIDAFGVMVSDKGKGPVELDFGGVALVDEATEGVVSFTFDDG